MRYPASSSVRFALLIRRVQARHTSRDRTSLGRTTWIVACLTIDGISVALTGESNGPLSSLLNVVEIHLAIDLMAREYHKHVVHVASHVQLVGSDIDPRNKAGQGS